MERWRRHQGELHRPSHRGRDLRLSRGTEQPHDRALAISKSRDYWNSRFRAFLWATVYSTAWEISPIGEAGIFNSGGYTYPIRCTGGAGSPDCERPTATYTNNTGWVDFIITPVVGTLWMVGEDTLDRYITDPLVKRHPGSFGYLVLRSGANPSRSLANMLRGRYPWYRDYEHPTEFQSHVISRFQSAVAAVPEERADLHLHYSGLSVRINKPGCYGCRNYTDGVGAELGVRVRRYLDIVTDVSVQPNASPISSLNIGRSLLTANFGLRSGYSGKHFALKASIAPGFASYSHTLPAPTAAIPNPPPGRNFNFQTAAAISGDVKLTQHLGFRLTVENMLIRYKNPVRDPDGIGTPPRLSFLSHDNYINSTNWGLRVGPVLRF